MIHPCIVPNEDKAFHNQTTASPILFKIDMEGPLIHILGLHIRSTALLLLPSGEIVARGIVCCSVYEPTPKLP